MAIKISKSGSRLVIDDYSQYPIGDVKAITSDDKIALIDNRHSSPILSPTLYTDIIKGDGSPVTDKADFESYFDSFSLGNGSTIALPITQNDVIGLEDRFEEVESILITALWYELIQINDTSDGQTGTITMPAIQGISIVANSLGGETGLIVDTKNNFPIENEVADTDPNTPEELIAVELNHLNGTYTIEGQLNSGETKLVAIIYQYRVTLKNYDPEFDINELPFKNGANASVTENFNKEIVQTPNQGQTIFFLSQIPVKINEFEFFINGQKQTLGVDFTISSNQVNFFENEFVINNSMLLEFNYKF